MKLWCMAMLCATASALVPPSSGSPAVKTTESGAPCTCLPYYMCGDNRALLVDNLETMSGWGQLDIRVSEGGVPKSQCQESAEVCCTSPRTGPAVDPLRFTPPLSETYRGCGYGNPFGLDFKLLGGTGTEALFGQYPWVVMLLHEDKYIGVGVLIHPEVVLTVAHKVFKITTPEDLVARAGEWDILTNKERLKHQNRNVKLILKHNEYFGAPYYFNDIALLRLESPVDLDSHINFICLPEQDETFYGSNCISNGWGKDAFGSAGKFVVIQKRVKLNMIQNPTCEDLFKRTNRLRNKGFWLHSSFVCAIAEEGWDTCEGDGGGPLACPFEANRFKLTGLTSWSVGCGDPNIPGAYVAVSKYRSWIDSMLIGWGLDISILTPTYTTTTRITTSPPVETTTHRPTTRSTTRRPVRTTTRRPTTTSTTRRPVRTTTRRPTTTSTTRRPVRTTTRPPITTSTTSTSHSTPRPENNCTCVPYDKCDWGVGDLKFGEQGCPQQLVYCCSDIVAMASTASSSASLLQTDAGIQAE